MDGLLTVTTPSRSAVLNMVLTIRSRRILGLYPEIVPLRKQITENSSFVSCKAACSPCNFEIPYG